MGAGAGRWDVLGGAERSWELGAGSWEELQGRDCWVHQIHQALGDTSRLYTLRYDVVML